MAYCKDLNCYVPDDLVDRWEVELETELDPLDFLEALTRCLDIDTKADCYAFIGRAYEVDLSTEEDI